MPEITKPVSQSYRLCYFDPQIVLLHQDLLAVNGFIRLVY